MKVLILDSNYICHAVFHSIPALTHNLAQTQVIFGFIKKLISVSRWIKPNNIVFAWDSKYSIRKEVYPKYKEQRAEFAKELTKAEKINKDLAYKQMDLLRNIVLHDLGFVNSYDQYGYEADDIIASVIKNNCDCEFIIASTDSDLYQLISDKCILYNPFTGAIMDFKKFKYEYGCPPSMWGEARSISGCNTDNVEGVKGVAEKTAIKYLFGELSENSKKYKDIKNHESITKINRELIVLPMYGTKKIVIKNQEKLSRIKFVKVCEKFGFKSLLSSNNLDKWDNLLLCWKR